MVSDSLTKLSTKSPPPAIDLLLYTLDTNEIRITYCEGSWRRELAQKKAGRLEQLDLMHPSGWNPTAETDYDCNAHRHGNHGIAEKKKT